MKILSLFVALALTISIAIAAGMSPSCTSLEQMPSTPTETTVVETVAYIIPIDEVLSQFNQFSFTEVDTIEECEQAVDDLEYYMQWLMKELIVEYIAADNFHLFANYLGSVFFTLPIRYNLEIIFHASCQILFSHRSLSCACHECVFAGS